MLSALLLMTGCSGQDVTLPDVDVLPSERAACEALIEDIPNDLGEERDRVPVLPADGLGAAWGDPAIVMTCGGEVPDISRTAPCTEVDGVGWFVTEAAMDDQAVPAQVVAVGFRPIVTVEIPADQRPEGVAAAMAGLAPAVRENTELVRPCL